MEKQKQDKFFSFRIALIVVIMLLITMLLGLASVQNIRYSQYQERVSTANMLMEKISLNISNGLRFSQEKLHIAKRKMEEDPFDSTEELQHHLSEMQRIAGDEFWLIDSAGWIFEKDGRKCRWRDPSQLLESEDLFLTGDYLVGYNGTMQLYTMSSFTHPITVEGKTYTHLVKVNELSDLDSYFEVSHYDQESFTFLIRSSGAQLYRQERENALDGVYNILSALKNADFAYGTSQEKMKQDIANGVDDTVQLRYEGRRYYVSYAHLLAKDVVAVIFIPEANFGAKTENFTFSILLSITVVFVSAMTMLLIFVIYLTTRKSRIAQAQAMEAEHRANQAKTDFLSSMSHDIRTPMNAIVGMAEIASQRSEDPAFVQECIGKIRLASRHLLTLINDILDISKIESGQMALSPDNFSLSEIIEDLCNITQTQVEERQQTLNVHRHNLRYDELYGDELRLKQICINILSNAVKYTEDGGQIDVDFYEEECDEPGKIILRYVVKDNGIGMSEEFQRTMYDTFARAVDSRLDKVPGTGLGLAIVKQMLDLMGGQIACQSAPGEGTTFDIRIPFTIGESFEEAKSEPEDSAECEGALPKAMHLLIAEDNDLNWEVISSYLEMYGIVSERAENGKICVERMEAAEEGTFDAILMDIRMPVMTGYEAARKIRKSDKKWVRTIPIIAVTADAFAEDVQACMEAGMNAHVARPIQFDKLLETLEELTKGGGR